uniref:SH3 and cysteine rich domain 2 n=1 Tax=Monopterus albus TaxID=43700 RepID=A0A3Q3IXL8_MONAL
ELKGNLQRLKRSLSFKNLMRSKSVENFFQRSYSDARLPPDFISDPPPPSPPLLPGSPVVSDRSPSISPSLSPNPSIASHSPSLSLSPSLPTKPPRPQINHCFQDHVFRKPTNCQHCKHMIVGNSKQALRCKTCKMAAHLWCTSELSQQLCHGKSGAFKRNFSSPILVNTISVCVVSEAVRARVDPVYAALRYGTSLAQMNRSSFGSLSESPTRSLSPAEESSMKVPFCSSHLCRLSPLVVFLLECVFLTSPPCFQVPKRIEVHSIHTYVALYKFLPQEPNDLQLHPGDRVQVTDDSNEEWWKVGNKSSANICACVFVCASSVYRNVCVMHLFSVSVLCPQICVGKREDGEMFLKLSSGKKRGLVPADSIEEI